MNSIFGLEQLAEYLSYPFVRYALVAGVLASLCASLLGVILVLKRYSFMGDGLSHVAFGAMAIAAVLNVTSEMIIIMPVTVLCAVLLLRRGQSTGIRGDAGLAMLSAGAMAVGYLLLNVFSTSSNISGDVCSTLFGSTSILTLKRSDVLTCVIMSVAVLAVFIIMYNKIFAVTFDENFAKASGVNTELFNLMMAVVTAVIIVLAMKLVGALLTSALIVFPPLSAMRIFGSFKKVAICSGAIGMTAALIGLCLSILLGTPVGSMVVVTNIVIFGVFSLIGFTGKCK